jgi:hypothetical protein
MKKPPPVYRSELDDIGDDDDVPVICPTCQAPKNGSPLRH